MLHKLTIIGEAAARMPPGVQDAHPDIPWRQITAFRNVVVHAYFSVDWELVWVFATNSAPQLGSQIEAILASDYHDIQPTGDALT